MALLPRIKEGAEAPLEPLSVWIASVHAVFVLALALHAAAVLFYADGKGVSSGSISSSEPVSRPSYTRSSREVVGLMDRVRNLARPGA